MSPSHDDHDDERPGTPVGLAYVLGRLQAVLRSPGPTADEKLRMWQDVLSGMADGSLSVGARVPVRGLPAWTTLEVATGGFATGTPLAGGPLQPFEHALAESVGLPYASRAQLNLHFTTDSGRAQLLTALRAGTYDVDVPEAGALMVVAHLAEAGRTDEAAALLAELSPYMARLRFYPRPAPEPTATPFEDDVARVWLDEVADVRAELHRKQPSVRVEAQREAILVWRPLTDQAYGLVTELLVQGAPWTPGAAWSERARAFEAQYARAARTHTRCTKHGDRHSSLTRLRRLLDHALTHGALEAQLVAGARPFLAGYAARWGTPGSEAWDARRAEQESIAQRPAHLAVCRVVDERLAALRQDEGSPRVRAALAPVSTDEAGRHHVAAGTAVPATVATKVRRALAGTAAELVEARVVTSSETLARLSPALTAASQSASVRDPALRQLYRQTYAAFRRRRSLLLVDYQQQVQLHELPWTKPLDPSTSAEARAACKRTLTELATLHLTAFPGTLTPNPLVRELRALTRSAAVDVPLVEELAVDIFMGQLSVAFLRSAQRAAGTLQGSLYERYYAVPYRAVARLSVPRDDEQTRPFRAPRARLSPELTALCERMAGPAWTRAKHTVRAGLLLEQAQVVTTHNIAPLVLGLDLLPQLPLLRMTTDTFDAVVGAIRRARGAAHGRLRAIKNAAYAFRQLVLYVSWMSPSDQARFFAFAEAQLDALRRRDPLTHAAFVPVQRGLVTVARGAAFDEQGRTADGGRRFLGWSVGPHWLTADAAAEARP